MAGKRRSRSTVFGIKRLFGIRRHHLIGAGTLASAIGLYSFGARVGLVPSDPTVAVRWLTGGNAPPIVQEAEKELAAAAANLGATPPAFGPTVPAFGQPTYP